MDDDDRVVAVAPDSEDSTTPPVITPADLGEAKLPLVIKTVIKKSDLFAALANAMSGPVAG